jgi:general secretion pathway protein D
VRLNVIRMLQSPEFHESKERDRPATGASSNCPSPIAAFRHIFSAKEAHSIGMTRGYSALFSISSSTSFRKISPSRGQQGCLTALFVLGAALAFGPSAHAQSASGWNKRGNDAELRGDYDTAYEAYLHAHQKKPADMRYTTRVDRMRWQAAASHVDRGRVMRQSGDAAGALNEFTRALQIDPSNQAASQEIQITQHPELSPVTGPGAAVGPLAGTTQQADLNHDINEVSGPLILKPVSDDLITLHMVEDTKVVYQSIGKRAGLNVLFDPDYQSKRIPVDLTNVDLTDALRIVALMSGTFYKAVTADTIFVAQNNRQKHTDLDDLSVQTFYLTNMSQANDGNEILTALRSVLPPDVKLYLATSQNALILRATPDQLMLAQKLINDLDRPKSEVVVDVAILEVNRDKIRNLGITLPQSFGLTPQANPNATNTASTTTTTNTNGTTTPTSSNFTLNSLANLNATNFAVTLSGGTLNALLTDADTRVLQEPSIRATDGQPATLKIGSKIPIATGSYGAAPGAGGAALGIGVQTQFQYLDVGTNISMTPTVHLDHEISLKMKVEVLSQTTTVTVSPGVTEPVIGQRSIEHTIQLREGEPSILAGILTKEDNAAYSGTPGLAQIPILKYFFGSVNKEVMQDEVVFVLIPHIVRDSPLTRSNTRVIDTGTSGTVELRHETANAAAPPDAIVTPPLAPGSATSAANAAAAMVQHMKEQALPPTQPAPGTPAAAAATAAAGPPVTISVLPANSSQPVGSTFQIAVLASNARDLYSGALQVQFDPKVLQLVNVDIGGLLGGDGQIPALVHRDEGNGLVTISSSRPPNVNGVSGQGDFCTMTFKAIGSGDSNIALVKVGAKDSKQANLPAVGSQAVVHVK